jgi:ubiquinone/menaquinone biosynthesis C-methylase UbiE
MTEHDYLWVNAAELTDRRLQLLELEYDDQTKRRALLAGVYGGSRCLDVGAGRGSIVKWLATVVGPAGTVVGIDIDARFLRPMAGDNVEIREINVVTEPLPEREFDFAHTRLVLLHIPQREHVLEKMVRSLRPGGAILCEEHDVAPLLGGTTGGYRTAWMAFVDASRAGGVEPTIGRALPSLLERFGCVDIQTECNTPLFRGGSREAEFWKIAWIQLQDRTRGAAFRPGVLDAGVRVLEDPSQWLFGPAMVAVTARVPL